GTVAGAILVGGWGFFDSWYGFFEESMADETLHWLVMLVVLFGILLTLFEHSNAVTDFARWTERFVNSRRKSMVLSLLLSIVLFIDDYLSALVVGTAMRKVTDSYKVPRTLLGTIVKMASAPICVLIPFSTWAFFFSGLLEAEGVTVNGSGFGAYLRAIPFIFFGWIALIIVALLVSGVFPLLGATRRDNRRALATGDVFPAGYEAAARVGVGSSASSATELPPIDAGGHAAGEPQAAAAVATATRDDGTARPLPFNFLIPVVIMVVVTIATDVNILKGTAAAVIVALILYLVQRRITFKGVLDAAFEGVGSMLFVVVLSVLAFMVQKINIELELADFVIGATQPFMNGALLPAVVFLVCGVYAYATGSFWDLAVVVTPLVVPLAFAMGVDPILAASAVFSGAALGSTTCLYGDGIILASRSTDLKPLNLMIAILPYAGIAAGISLVLYLITGLAGVTLL
ncbi:Na+/H+ antiporter NhaC family protein, partial [Microbacterium sp. CCH5-D1]|uniref:Na+/H+ antiporter NhaC family protein n=1 Tax=Microbacterium sp. CCH5-D1 TaxID=1768780 RepID=UPI00076A1C3D